MTATLTDTMPAPARPRREPRAAVPEIILPPHRPEPPGVSTEFDELAEFIARPGRLDAEDGTRFRLAVGRACRRHGLAEPEFWLRFLTEEAGRGRSRAEVSLRYQIPLTSLPILPEDAAARAHLERAREAMSQAERELEEAAGRARKQHQIEGEIETLKVRIREAKELADRMRGWIRDMREAIETQLYPTGPTYGPAPVPGEMYGAIAGWELALADNPAQTARLEAALAERERALAELTSTTAN